MTPEEQQSFAKTVLDKLRTLDPDCYLAGGAPRDWVMGKACNDLDFYMHTDHESPEELRRDLTACGIIIQPMRSIHWDRWENLYTSNEVPGSDESDDDEAGVLGKRFVFEDTGDKLPIQIMWFTNAEDRTEAYKNFSVNLSQIKTDLEDGVLTEAFQMGFRDRTLRYKDCIKRDGKYVQKMKQYFPESEGWRHVIEVEV